MKKAVLLLVCLLFSGSGYAAGFSEVLTEFKSYDGVKFRGKMTYPEKMTGKKVGVLLIHGSGPMDMNLYLPGFISADGKPNKAFETIAHNLGENDVISFRYNKRGVEMAEFGSPDIDYPVFDNLTWTQLVGDAYSALEVLRKDPNVDQDKILILGISQGTMIAPAVAKKAGYVDGLLLLASIGKSSNNYKEIAALKLPTLLLHGEVDTVTPLDEAELILKELQKNKIPVEIHTYPGLGHGFSPTIKGDYILGPIDLKVVDAIPAWINKTF